MSDPFDLRALRVVAAAIETGSMSQAARRYGLTQPAVSQTIARIEAALGMTLVDRRRRPLVPTAAGRILLARLGDVNREMDDLVGALRMAATMPERIDLRLGMVDSIAGTIGARLVEELVNGKTALSLTAWSGLAFSHAEDLMRRTIDGAITCDPMAGLEEIDRYPIFTEPYLLIVPRGQGRPLGAAALDEILARHRLVRHSERSFVGAQVERHLRRLGLRPPRSFEFDTSDALVAMVATGMGVALTTPLCLMQGIGHAAGVDVLPLPGPGFSRDLLLATRKGEITVLAGAIAHLARDIVERRLWPRLTVLAPWLPPSPGGA